MDDGTGTIEYADHFRSAADVAHYDLLYAEGTRDRHIWTLQQPLLRRVVDEAIEDRSQPRLLDFACGTGRVLGFVESRFAIAHGVDISASMLDKARRVVGKARLVHGDLLTDDLPVEDDYDVVTAFRFFLNAPPELRLPVLTRLRELLVARSGVLVFNNHGNARSLRHVAVRFGGRRATLRNELSDDAVTRLLDRAGFRIERRFGVGLFPDVVYRSPLRPVAAWLDTFQARAQKPTSIAIDHLYVATPA